MAKLGTSLILTISVLLPLAALASPPREHIDQALVRFVSAINSGDAATVASLYSANAALLPPDAARVNGRAGIQAFWQGVIDAGITIDSLRAVEVEARGDMAYEVGGFELSVPGESGTTKVTGKYIVVWKRSGHTWQLHRDIWNMTPTAE